MSKETKKTPREKYSRRDFLKVVGASSGLAASGCAGDIPEKIIPYVVQPDEIVPGVAAWYSGLCGGCSAGCGVMVRTREGRAVKVEGNPYHPVNKGKLCAIGQSTLQTLYDPDRLREPLSRDSGGGAFKPVSWPEAVKKIAAGISKLPQGKETVLLTGPVSGSLEALISKLKTELPSFRHLIYDNSGRDALDLAAELSFGEGSRVDFDFAPAETVVSFGADFLETWLSPVEFARQWRDKRTDSKNPSKFFHIEPRLSLTAANADSWIMNAPGSEAAVMLELLKFVAKKKGAIGGFASLIQQLSEQTAGTNSDVPTEKIEQIASALLSSSSSIIVAGGPAIAGQAAVTCAVIANALNSILGNIGKTVLVRKGAGQAKSNSKEIFDFIASLQKKNSPVGALIISGVNPVFTLPTAAGFTAALAKIPFIASLATNMDETTSYANVVLPASTTFESWSDNDSRPGLFALNQPAMQPLYETQSLGDTLLSVAGVLDIKTGHGKSGKVASFQDYIQSRWKARTGEGNFTSRWNKYVELGGDWKSVPERGGEAAFSLAAVKELIVEKSSSTENLMAFPTVTSHDGSSANRPWLQELPNPITSVVWGSWAEMHQDKAKALGLSEGDVVQLRSENGAIEVPVYPTKHIHPSLVAVPIGQGHKSFGRYSNGIGANPLSILSMSKKGGRSLSIGIGGIRRGSTSDEFVKTQDFTDQYDRGILRTVEAGSDNDHGSHHDTGHGGGQVDSSKQPDQHHKGGHHDLLALGPQDEPKQMYEQMEHPSYRWGMSIDLASCTGCSACVVACYAENNIPVVGKELCEQGREMSWLRIDRYEKNDSDHPITGFQPMLCQHCGNAPCEPVCPVYATYHNEDGLNTMVYNRCVGTRYCSNNCSYKVRRFNWFHYSWPEPLNWQLNPDVTVRTVGVMEKCSFCAQRIREGTNNAKNEGRPVKDGEIQPACASTCPTDAITFGNLLDKDSQVAKNSGSDRGYRVLDSQINTQPAVTYLAKIKPEGLGGSHSSDPGKEGKSKSEGGH